MRVVMLRTIAVASLLGCGGADEPEPGALQSGIISGRVQSVRAGEATLPEPVVNQVVRAASGGGLYLVRANTDQTVVKGSPVPGAVVCVYEGDKDLLPLSRCTNTDSAGKATFFFAPPTKAGQFIARINGSLTTHGKVEATTFDTAKATVLPGLADSTLRGNSGGPRPSPVSVSSVPWADKYSNPIPYRITADARITPRDTVIGRDSSTVITFASVPADSALHSVVLVTYNETPTANLWYRIRTTDGVAKITWIICGLKVSCGLP